MLKDAVCSSPLHNPAAGVQRGKVALEGNVARLHVDPRPHALKGAPPPVVPACQNALASWSDWRDPNHQTPQNLCTDFAVHFAPGEIVPQL